MYLSEKRVLTNNILLKFSFSIPGLWTILILVIINVFLLTTDVVRLVILSQNIYLGNKFKLSKVFGAILKNFSKVIKILLVQLFLHICIILSLLFMIISPKILNAYLPTFFANILVNTPLKILIILTIIITSYMYLIKNIFAIHISIIEGLDFKTSLIKSKNMCKSKLWNISGIILLLYVFIISCTLILFFIIGLAFVTFMKKSGFNSFPVLTSLSLFSVFSSIIMFLVSIFAIPINIIIITRLYYFIEVNDYDSKLSDYMEYGINTPSSFKELKHNNIFIIITCSALIMLFTIILLVTYYSSVKMNAVHITAHRGTPIYAPENSLSALQYAINNGADYAEIDVQETADGEVVLLHDTNLKRVTGINKNIWDVTYDELKYYSIGKKFINPFGEKFRGEKIPSLRQAIKLCKGKIKLNIELKANGHDPELSEKVLKILEEENFKDQCIISSVNYESLKKVRNLDPTIKIGTIVYIVIEDMSNLDVDFYSIETDNATEKFIHNSHLLGREVHVWTVNNEKNMTKLIDLGVDNIITDHPYNLKNLLEESKNNKIINLLFK